MSKVKEKIKVQNFGLQYLSIRLRALYNVNMLNKSLIILCLVSICGSIVYRFYALNNFGVFLTIVLVAAGHIIARKQYNKNNNLFLRKFKYSIFYNLYFILFYAFLFICFYILFTSLTTRSIISPWQVVPWYFFIFYGLTAYVFLIIINIQKKIKQPSNQIIFLFFTPFCFLSFSVALIVYKINYGFDPFIHQATLDLINKKGFVDPKPFYYLGQYSLEIIIHKITNIPLFWIDKLLVPLLASIYLPIVLYRTLREKFKKQTVILLAILSLLIFPFSFFIITTPQNLAYLFLILSILFGISGSDLFIIYLLALAAFVTHPIAGIPALSFAFAIMIHRSKFIFFKYKKYFYSLIFTLTIFTLPLLFYIFEKGSHNSQHGYENNYNFFTLIPKIIIPSQENIILNFVYFYGFNVKIFIAALALIGFIVMLRNKKIYKTYFIYFGFSIALFLSYFLTTYLPFDFLISYERSNYADRIFQVASFFLLPFLILAIYKIILKAKQQNKFVCISFGVFGILLITASLYTSYPRVDHYFNSRGYSTSENDIKAVRWINDNAESGYIVLANQQVSAAALNEFGFKKYYKRDIFYYPVPTGGSLYQYYLDMVYDKPSRKTMKSAMDLAGVNSGYFVLNKYWWAFKKILDEAKLSADEWKEFDGGEVYVFKY